MTTEQKINWLKNATAEELISQFKSSVRTYDKGSALDKENFENLMLVQKEILKRLNK